MSDLFVDTEYVFLTGKRLPIPTLPYPHSPKYPVDRMVDEDAVCSEGDVKTFLSVLLNWIMLIVSLTVLQAERDPQIYAWNTWHLFATDLQIDATLNNADDTVLKDSAIMNN